MKKAKFDERKVFLVIVEDLQQEAHGLIGRKLTEEEIYSASKGVEAGLCSCLDIVLRTAIEEAVEM